MESRQNMTGEQKADRSVTGRPQTGRPQTGRPQTGRAQAGADKILRDRQTGKNPSTAGRLAGNKESERIDVLVIGGGAAGMMAAIAAASSGARVCLLEKNEKLGKKLFITGKGRCNVTNAGNREDFFTNVMSNPKFLYSAFAQFDNQDVMTLLENAGCRLKVERGNRVFPVSDHSADVIDGLKRELHRYRVDVRLHAEVKQILTEGEAVVQSGFGAAQVKDRAGQLVSGTVNRKDGQVGAGTGQLASGATNHKAGQITGNGVKEQGTGTAKRVSGVLLADGSTLTARAVVVATGGIAYPSTGSTGDGYRFAAETGHSLRDRQPSLVPLIVSQDWCRKLMGLSLKNVSVRLVWGEKELYSGFGEMLFTHFGVSGPLILTASSFYGEEKLHRREGSAGNRKCMLYIDLKPALTPEQLDRRLLHDFEMNSNKDFQNALGDLFPARLVPVMIRQSGIAPTKKVHEITREERTLFCAKIKALPLTVVGAGDYNEAVITKGGVTVRDINPASMASRLVEGLYFAGEVLDLDALTGGYNLQIAWSTGHLAGKSAAEYLGYRKE